MTPCRNRVFQLQPRLSLLAAALVAGSVMLALPAHADSTPRTQVAQKVAAPIQYRAEIEGPVTAIKGDTLTVLGQTVKVDKATVYADKLKAGVGALKVGQVLEIDGVADAQGVITASRIELEDDKDPYKLRGRVSHLDASKRTFKLGDAVISYADVSPNQKENHLSDGTQVEVRMHRDAKSDVWQATRVRTVGDQVDAKAVSAELEGKVSEVIKSGNQITGLVVHGIKIDTKAAKLPSGLEKDSKVEVKGHLKDGVLTAKKVDKEMWIGGDGGLQIEGRILSVDAKGQTFTLNGVAVDFRGSSIDDGKTAAALLPGVKVEVEGTLSRDGKTLVAKNIDID